MAPHRTTTDELKDLIKAFRKQVSQANRKAEAAIGKIEKASYESYYEYREAIISIEGVIALIEDRIEHIPEAGRAEFTELYNTTISSLLSLKMDVVMRIFGALATATRLPMGGKKVFLGTIHDLDQARKMVDERGFAHLLDQDARHHLDKAREILETVANKAPRLMSLAADDPD